MTSEEPSGEPIRAGSVLGDSAAAGGQGYRAAFLLALAMLAAAAIAGAASMVRYEGGPASLSRGPRVLAAKLLEEGRPHEAAAELRSALVIDPWDTRTAARLGELLGKRGDWAGARDVYTTALSHRPRDLRLRAGLGSAQSAMGHLDEAVATLDTVLAQDPAHVAALCGRGNAALAMGDAQTARAMFQRAIDVAPTDPYAHNGMGATLGELRDFDGSIEHFERATRLLPGELRFADNLKRARRIRERQRQRRDGRVKP